MATCLALMSIKLSEIDSTPDSFFMHVESRTEVSKLDIDAVKTGSVTPDGWGEMYMRQIRLGCIG